MPIANDCAPPMDRPTIARLSALAFVRYVLSTSGMISLTVLMEDVQVPRNLAAILRSCDAVGVFEAHAVWPGGRLKLSRPASGGTRKWVPVRKHRTLEAALHHFPAAAIDPQKMVLEVLRDLKGLIRESLGEEFDGETIDG